jgi:hypothetical protein
MANDFGTRSVRVNFCSHQPNNFRQGIQEAMGVDPKLN